MDCQPSTSFAQPQYVEENEERDDEKWLQDRIDKLLECMVCTDVMIGPIYLCVNGHAICCQCLSKLEKCPECRGPYTTNRCYVMESIANSTTIPCRFRHHGCPIREHISTLYNHEIRCHYMTTKCAMRNCRWTGPLNYLARHHVDNHINNDNINRTINHTNPITTTTNPNVDDPMMMYYPDPFFSLFSN